METDRQRTRAERVRLTGLTADAFISQTDRIALENLQRLPLLPVIVRKFHEFAVDRLYYVNVSATCVRCGPEQFSTLHRLLEEACGALDVPQPELYVAQSPMLNAFTAGINRPFIVLQSSLLDQMTDDEVLFILGHELGHIKCGHVLYQMIGYILLALIDALGRVTLGVGQIAAIGVVSAFFEWMRQAEFSCDRAGLLACQDPKVSLSALMKLGCGGTRLVGEMNTDAFLQQARAHSEAPAPEGMAKAFLFLLYNWQLTHPQVVYRAKGLDDWVTSGAYERLLEGGWATAAEPQSQPAAQAAPSPTAPPVVPSTRWCPSCRTSAPADAVLCPKCHGFLTTAPTEAGIDEEPPQSTPPPADDEPLEAEEEPI